MRGTLHRTTVHASNAGLHDHDFRPERTERVRMARRVVATVVVLAATAGTAHAEFLITLYGEPGSRRIQYELSGTGISSKDTGRGVLGDDGNEWMKDGRLEAENLTGSPYALNETSGTRSDIVHFMFVRQQFDRAFVDVEGSLFTGTGDVVSLNGSGTFDLIYTQCGGHHDTFDNLTPGTYSGVFANFDGTHTLRIAEVPEPSTLVLAALGVVGLAAFGWGWRMRQ